MTNSIGGPLPNNHVDNSTCDNSKETPYHYGWFNIRPKFLQRFLSAKWALFWLCWAGAMQGKTKI